MSIRADWEGQTNLLRPASQPFGLNSLNRAGSGNNHCRHPLAHTEALSILLEHMHKKFEMNQTKIKGSCQSGRKVVTHNSKSDLPLGSVK